jgi:uncharacterized coiled-coil protein SlyX
MKGLKMSEQKPEKKVVSRTLAIALGIICIILIAGLGGAIADYTSIINGKDNSISSQSSQILHLNNTVRSQNNTITQQNNTITQQNTTIADLNGSNEYLQNQVYYLYNATNLKNRVILENGTEAPTEFTKETVGIGYYMKEKNVSIGYMLVQIKMPTPNSTTLSVTWSSSGTNWNKTVNVGMNTIIVFPVLPTNVTITIERANMFYEEEVLYY